MHYQPKIYPGNKSQSINYVILEVILIKTQRQSFM